jgi:hypothetical protein
MGISGTIAMGALVGGGMSYLNGGNFLQGALLGGVLGGVGGELGGVAGTAGGDATVAPTVGAGGAVTSGAAGAGADAAALGASGIGGAPAASMFGPTMDGSLATQFATAAPGATVDVMGTGATGLGSGVTAGTATGLGSGVTAGTAAGTAPSGALSKAFSNLLLNPDGTLNGVKAMQAYAALNALVGPTPTQRAQSASQTGSNYLNPTQGQSLNPNKPGMPAGAPSISNNPYAYQNMFAKPAFAKGGALKRMQESTMMPHPPRPGGMIPGSAPGQEDNVPIMGSPGEFMVPADVVSHLGDGNNNAGALKLHKMMREVRRKKGAGPKLPPKAGPLSKYLEH